MTARMTQGGREARVMILNVSRRGLLVSGSEPPARGEYVEIRANDTVIVGRVAWSRGRTFGVRAQDDVDAASLTGARPATPLASSGDIGDQNDAARLRRAEPPDPLCPYERSRIRAARSTFITRVIFSCAAAAAVALLAYEMSANPIAAISEALSR